MTLGAARWLLWEQAKRNAPKVLNRIPKPRGIKLPKLPKGKELLPAEKVEQWYGAQQRGMNPAFSPKDILLSSTIADQIANLPPVRKLTDWGGQQIAKSLTPLGRGIDDLLPGMNSADERRRKGYSPEELEAAYTLPEHSSLELQKRAGTQPRTWQNPYGTGAQLEEQQIQSYLDDKFLVPPEGGIVEDLGFNTKFSSGLFDSDGYYNFEGDYSFDEYGDYGLGNTNAWTDPSVDFFSSYRSVMGGTNETPDPVDTVSQDAANTADWGQKIGAMHTITANIANIVNILEGGDVRMGTLYKDPDDIKGDRDKRMKGSGSDGGSETKPEDEIQQARALNRQGRTGDPYKDPLFPYKKRYYGGYGG